MSFTRDLRRPLTAALPLLGVATSVAVTLLILIGPLFGADTWGGFRLYMAQEQLPLMRVAVVVADGGPWFTEPFTHTGTNFHPIAWYVLLGVVSALTGLGVATVWTVLGALVVAATTLVFSVAAWRMSGKWWASFTPAIAITAGTASTLLQGPSFEGYWHTRIGPEWTLWGPFASIFTLDGGVIATSFVLLASLLLLLATSPGAKRRTLMFGSSGILVGASANFNEPAFLSGLFLIGTWGTCLVLLQTRSRRLVAITSAIFALALTASPWVSTALGSTFAFALVLLAAFPAGVHQFRHNRVPLLAIAIPLLVCSLPQVLRTLDALSFMAEPPESSALVQADIGAFVIRGAVCAGIAILVFVATCMAPSLQRAHRALLIALFASAIVVATSPLSGFGDDPAAMWLSLNFTALLLLAVLTPVVFSRWHRRRKHWPRRYPAALLVLVMAGSLYVTSFGDLLGFWKYAQKQGTMSEQPETGSDDAALQRAVNASTELLGADPCIDALHLALLHAGPVALLHDGIGVPNNEEALKAFLANRDQGRFDATAMRLAGVATVVTSDSCADAWSPEPRDGYFPVNANDGYWVWETPMLTR